MPDSAPLGMIVCAHCGGRSWYAFPDGANSYILECPGCGVHAEIAAAPGTTLLLVELPEPRDVPREGDS